MKTATVDVQFAIGDKVQQASHVRYAHRGTVVGYDVRYVVRNSVGTIEHFSRRADYLEAVPKVDAAELAALRSQINDVQLTLRALNAKLVELER